MAGVRRPARLIATVAIVLVIFLVLRSIGTPGLGGMRREKIIKMERDPNLDATGEPSGYLHRVKGNNYDPDNRNSDRISATLLSLVRNSEVDELVRSMQDLERTWNHKFNYPWTFFNDEDFSDEFKEKTQAVTKAECRYERIPKEHWEVPSWINHDLMKESGQMLKEQDIQYGEMTSYHQMCRWNSGLFYKHPALENIQYYWRVEPKVEFYCDVDYDVFRFMQDRNKTYGFTINLYDNPKTITTLWPETLKFIASAKELGMDYVHPHSAFDWLTDSEHRPDHTKQANGYSTCHFWSNFEIANLDFWRSNAYEEYFQHLDRAGGFFYERWGDAPVHSIGVGLFEDVNKIHWFKDIGYRHIPYFNCPNSPKCSRCEPGKFYDGAPFLQKEDCRPSWFKHIGNEWAPSNSAEQQRLSSGAAAGA